jgi:hypothetical protein
MYQLQECSASEAKPLANHQLMVYLYGGEGPYLPAALILVRIPVQLARARVARQTLLLLLFEVHAVCMAAVLLPM